jgi:hypothetical protein
MSGWRSKWKTPSWSCDYVREQGVLGEGGWKNLFVEGVKKNVWAGGGLVTDTTKTVKI